jgi:hypothetical protein
MWSWTKQALFGDDLFVWVIFASLGFSVIVGLAFILPRSLADWPAHSVGPAILAVVFLGSVFLGPGALQIAAAFSSRRRRLWRWAERIDPSKGAGALDELIVILVAVLIAPLPLALLTLILRTAGVRGKAW